jgi:hypothetical protein
MQKVLLVLVVAISLFAGYWSYPLIHQQPSIEATPTFSYLASTGCEIGSDQLDSIAARLAPSVVKQLTGSGVSINSEIPARTSDENKDEQAQAFSQATEKIDQMISSRQVTSEGLSQANNLLKETNQSHRSYELMARISAAINRGELTPAEAGMVMP